PAIHESPRAAQPIYGQLIVVADNEVMTHVERRQRTCALIEEINLFAIARRVVERFGIGVASKKLEILQALPQSKLNGVIAGLSDRYEIALTRKIAAKRASSSALGSPTRQNIRCILSARAARRYAQTKCGIARIGF